MIHAGPLNFHYIGNGNWLREHHSIFWSILNIEPDADIFILQRAAKLLKKEGARTIYALITHGVFSGDAIDKINASALDKVIVTNSVPQEANRERCSKLEVLDIGHIFAEASELRNIDTNADFK